MDDHWLVRRSTIRLLWAIFLIVLAITLALQAFVPLHGHFGLDGSFGFNAWFGFGTCALMIVGAKALGLLLKRPDTYYAAEEDRHD